MVPRSRIGWTDFSGGDANFVLRGRAAGDCEVSPGCANCYAGEILRRSGATGERTSWSEKKLNRLARAKFEAGDAPFRRGPGSRPLVFVCDMGDLFHEAVPMSFIVAALNVMAARSDVDWQVLTKRAQRMSFVADCYGWPQNVWAGVTAENEAAAVERIQLLRLVGAKVRFVSCEPLLGPVDLSEYLPDDSIGGVEFEAWIHWVIVGGESGRKRRAFDVAWARELREQCRASGTAFFFKQGSDLRPGRDDLLDGVSVKEFPQGQEGRVVWA